MAEHMLRDHKNMKAAVEAARYERDESTSAREFENTWDEADKKEIKKEADAIGRNTFNPSDKECTGAIDSGCLWWRGCRRKVRRCRRRLERPSPQPR